MIELRNVSFAYPGADVKSLDGVTLDVAAGECVVVTGASGCGKSTLSRVLNGLCPKFYEGDLTGTCLIGGRDVRDLELDEIGSLLGSVFQDPRSQFFARRVRDEVVLALENHCLPREVQRERLAHVSRLLGIEGLLDRDMCDLSSGEKQKVAIASVFALGPQGLVLDEPSANLDAETTEYLGSFLAQLKRDGRALVVCEHRLHYLKDVLDRLIIMRDGRIVEDLSRAEALSLSEADLRARGLRLLDEPSITTGREGAAGQEQGVDRTGAPLVRAERLVYGPRRSPILKGIDFSIPKGTVVALTGKNGAGKTSLCRVLSGLQRESAGGVYVGGARANRRARISSTFFVQQDVDYQLYTPTVEEEILMASAFPRESERFARTVRLLGIAPVLKRHPNTLSGGQKQRVLIAAAVLRDAPLIMLDEPTSGLDGGHMRSVARILRRLAAEGKSVLLVTHDREFIAEVADEVVWMDGGLTSRPLRIARGHDG